jgi:hypothetical protein
MPVSDLAGTTGVIGQANALLTNSVDLEAASLRKQASSGPWHVHTPKKGAIERRTQDAIRTGTT